MGGGAEGVTEAGAFCPIIVRALTDAASIAFTNSRRRISLLLRHKNSPAMDRGGRKPCRLTQIKIVKTLRVATSRRRAEEERGGAGEAFALCVYASPRCTDGRRPP